MALLWKPCFQVWPFYGNHVSKYDPFMDTMFFKYGPLMEKYGSSVTILTKYKSF